MEIIVEEGNERLDKFLSTQTDYSRSVIQKMIEEEYITVNDNIEKASFIIKPCDKIVVKEGFIKEMDLLPEKMDINIVYEDEFIMVVDKDSGLVVHPGNGNESGTLVNGLLYHTNSLSDGAALFRPGIVHRLDKDTSGLMIVAKTNKVHEILGEQFKNRLVNREYTALLVGELNSDSATIDAPIGRNPNERKKMIVTNRNSKKAITQLKVIKRYNDYTLVNFILETGKTHQIRVHAKYIGYPVYNDPAYSNNSATKFGQYLHSSKIEFLHPVSNKKMLFESKLPKEFKDYITKLEKQSNI